MTPRLRRLSGADVVAILRTFGFEVVRTRGSHAKLRRTTAGGENQILTIPLHKELAAGTLHAIRHTFTEPSRRARFAVETGGSSASSPPPPAPGVPPWRFRTRADKRRQ